MSRLNKQEQQIIEEANFAAAMLDELGVPQELNGEHLTLVQRVQRALNPTGRDRLLTSHDVGRMLQMDPSSVVKWMNDGILPGYRTPGGHRRIKASELRVFLGKHQMYVPPELTKMLEAA